MFPFNHGRFSETPQWNLQPTSTRVSAGTAVCCWACTQRWSTCNSMRSFRVSAWAMSYHDSSRQLSSESAKGQADVCISICSWIVKPFCFVVLIGMDMNYAYDKLDHSNSLAFSSLIFLSLTVRLLCLNCVVIFTQETHSGCRVSSLITKSKRLQHQWSLSCCWKLYTLVGNWTDQCDNTDFKRPFEASVPKHLNRSSDAWTQ